MGKFVNLLALVLAVIILSPLESVYAQAPAKKSLPQVPITYPGDTDKTILRRAQWIEGAKREGKLVWWGTDNPKLKQELIAEFNKVYPFIQFDHWRSQGAEIGSRMEAEHTRGRFTVDICQGGESFNYPRWRKMGIMGKFTDIVPGIDGIDRRMYSKYGDWIIPGNTSITMKGAAFPGAGTMTSKALEGMNLVYRTEDTEFQIVESGVIKRFAQILGITPTEDD